MKKRLRKMILIFPILVSLTAMSTKDLKNTQMDLPEKDGKGVQIDIDLSTGDIHDKKPEKTESQDRGEGETVGTGRDIQQEILQQNQAYYEHIKVFEEKIDSLKSEIIRINSSNQRLRINYDIEKSRVSELESEIIRIKKSYEKAGSKPEQEVLTLNLTDEEHGKDTLTKAEPGTFNIREDKDYIKLQTRYDAAKNRIVEMELEIIELRKTNEEIESKQEQEIASLQQKIEGYRNDTGEKSDTVITSTELDGDKDFTALKNDYGSAKKQTREMEIKIIELEKLQEKNRNKYEQEILSLKQTLADNSKMSGEKVEPVKTETPEPAATTIDTETASRLSGTASRLSGTSNSLSRPDKDEQVSPEPPAGYQEPPAVYSETATRDLALAGEIFFESGKTFINPAGEAFLKQLGSTLIKHPDKTIRIVGHTDDVKIGPVLRARYFTNWDLASRRAAGVALYLQNEFGIDPHRITVVSYAQFRPAGSNSTEEGRTRNRRVEIFVSFDNDSGRD